MSTESLDDLVRDVTVAPRQTENLDEIVMDVGLATPDRTDALTLLTEAIDDDIDEPDESA